MAKAVGFYFVTTKQGENLLNCRFIQKGNRSKTLTSKPEKKV